MPTIESILKKSGQDVLDQRASNTAKIIKSKQENLVNQKKEKVIELENKLINLTDLSITSTQSLTPVNSLNFNPEYFVEQVQLAKEELKIARYDLEIAEETYKEWFPVG